MNNKTYNIVEIPCLYNFTKDLSTVTFDIFYVLEEKIYFQVDCYCFLQDSLGSFIFRLWVVSDKANFEKITNFNLMENFELNVSYKLALPQLDNIEESIGKVLFKLNNSSRFPILIPMDKSSYLYKCYIEGVNLNEMITHANPENNVK